MVQNSLITLTSDLGNRDFYLAALKGAIFKINPEARIIDLSIEILTFNIIEAAYQVRSALKDFPEKTIHLITIEDEFYIDFSAPEKNKVPCVMLFKQQYFVANNNGVFSLILEDEQPEGFWEINADLSPENVSIFTSKEIMAPFAAKLSLGAEINTIATRIGEPLKAQEILPTISENELFGHVIHVDDYGNLITNISRKMFDEIGNGEPFTIFLRKNEYHIESIKVSYMDVPVGLTVAIFNGNNQLEIAVRNGFTKTTKGASSLLGLKTMSPVRIEFTPRGSKQNLTELF
jgi:S-adenosyl-L-methionine hydrolase (adenosine-forming)